jgi:glycosyltransferase involved in cell wall biosynthesis
MRKPAAQRRAHIAIDGRKYFDFGVGTYVQNLAAGISRSNSSHSYTLLVSSEDESRIQPPKGWHVHATSLRKYSLGEMAFLGRESRQAGADLLHVPHYTLPLGLRRRSVVTIHDLVHVAFPQYFTRAQRTYAHAVLRHAVKAAGAVITGSHRAKADIVDLFRIDERRIHVIYHGIQSYFRKIDDRATLQEFRDRFDLHRPFILYVGSIKPHKNIPALLKAFEKLFVTQKDLDLVFVGEWLYENKELSALVDGLGIRTRVRDLGRLPTEALVCAYNSAELLVLPSLYEGFGFTAVEAMACGTPAVVSNRGSLPEVVGDAALIVDPSKPGALESGLLSVLTDRALRKSLIANGRENIKRFSWDATAKETIKVYELVLNATSHP